MLDITLCVSAEPHISYWLHATVSAAKVMCCIQCYVVHIVDTSMFVLQHNGSCNSSKHNSSSEGNKRNINLYLWLTLRVLCECTCHWLIYFVKIISKLHFTSICLCDIGPFDVVVFWKNGLWSTATFYAFGLPVSRRHYVSGMFVCECVLSCVSPAWP